MARYNTISEAPGPIIFVPMLSNRKKLVQSVLKATPNRLWRFVRALAPCQRLDALNLSNPALGPSWWPICTSFRISMLLQHRTSARNEAFPPASCTGSANKTTMVVVVLVSPAGKAPVPFGTTTCSATANLKSLPARPTKGLPLESSTAFVAIRSYSIWFGCDSWSNPNTPSIPTKHSRRSLGEPRSYHPLILHARTHL